MRVNVIKAVHVVAILVLCYGMSMAQTLPDKYHTVAEGIAELQALVTANPSICRLDSIGYSNRDSLPIFMFKISDNVSVEEDEPAIFFDGGVHADEVLGVEVVLNFCADIVSRYVSGDTLAQRYVNGYEIFVIPFINPEGHIVVESGDTDWRKNKTDNNSNGIFDFGDGVDNNRNYDFGWNIDAAPDAIVPESLQYKGPYPYSESENRALRDLGMKYKPLIAVDYHSPTYGRTEVVYYNWYWYASDGGNGMAPDELSMRHIGDAFAGSIVDDAGDSSYEARRALVNKGDYKTYFYANFGTAAFVCEISDTTIQDTSLVDSICQRHLPGMYYLLRRAGYARLTGVVTDSITSLPLEAEVEVQQATSPDINPRFTRPTTGRYDRLIDPGTYTLVFRKDGYASKTVTGVVVTNSGPTTRNVQLAPSSPPPATPILVSPQNGAAVEDSLALNFDWNDATYATGYVVEIARDPAFADLFERDSTVTLSTYRNTIPFTFDQYYWRITAWNGAGFSGRSQTWAFSIDAGAQPPTAPALVAPGDGFLSISAYLHFDWTDSEGATRYALQIADDIDFGSVVIGDTMLTDSQFDNTDSLANGLYYWRVKAGNQEGWSDYSQVWSFEVSVDTAGIVYLIGDVNHNGQTNGIDVVYFVSYLKGGSPPPLEIDGFYPEADVNGNCLVNGIDVVYFVSYLKGGAALIDGHCLR
jgi:hypothetical protein